MDYPKKINYNKAIVLKVVFQFVVTFVVWSTKNIYEFSVLSIL